MKPRPDNTGAEACNETGITAATTHHSHHPISSSQLLWSLPSSINDQNISGRTCNTGMASGHVQNNGSSNSNSSNTINITNTQNNSRTSGESKSNCLLNNGTLTSKPTSLDTTDLKKLNGAKMMMDGGSPNVTNGNSPSLYSNGHASDSSSSNTTASYNNNNNVSVNNKNTNTTNGSIHHSHHPFNQHHSPITVDAATVAAAVLNTTPSLETENFQPVYLDYPLPQEEESNQDHRNELLTSINVLRKQDQFCDIKLLVEEHEFPAHRAVLAASSPYLFDFLSCLEESECLQPIYRIKEVSHIGFEHLLDFMYSGRLHVPLSQVPVVYGTALVLRMETPTRACADFLSSHLTEANCLVIRRFSKDSEFRSAVDDYIRGHMEEILGSKSFFGLTNLQVEVVGLDESIEDETMERRLFSLVLDWAKTNLNDLKPKMNRLTEQVNVLYLNPDNTLMDCAEIEDNVLSSDDDVINDYKKMARRRSKTKHASSPSTPSKGGNPQPFHKFSLNPQEAVSVAEREWSIIATRKTNDNAYLSIAVLDGQLMAVSIHVRLVVPTSNDSNGSVSAPDSPSSLSVNGRSMSPVFRKASIAPLESMSTARCAMGAVATMDGQILVFGGYDRGECLQSVELFSLLDNQWTSAPEMKAARGRFSATALGGYIYTCGGSDGWKELSCVERFEPATGQWNFVANMIKERSSHGLASLNDHLYCVGGSDGQRSLADCEMYDPSTNKWSPIASLNIARTQTSLCAFQGLLYAIGGTDSWNTLNSVEVYSPEQGEWILSSNLNIARRGAGVDIVDGTMIVVGGSDGVQSLTSTEFYNTETCQWSVGPPMLTPRANLSAVTVGSRLFAIGGFSGKKFLSSMEWLDMEDNEWLCHAPRVVDLNASSGSNLSEMEKEMEEGGLK